MDKLQLRIAALRRKLAQRDNTIEVQVRHLVGLNDKWLTRRVDEVLQEHEDNPVVRQLRQKFFPAEA